MMYKNKNSPNYSNELQCLGEFFTETHRDSIPCFGKGRKASYTQTVWQQ